ncbi:hypothetical protein DNTS_009146 [Danionella cerebrum]|uniref:Transcription factor HES-5 n=1 Tax=Danionella cerebrum TaxID=2873325 RepID=A0A553QAV6_9TELE|nr:hypothetical protein DNTS_009139 [Danionella translucida]TRY87047.1 hypothetical protein DNTS_009146 [Danionella translucida]
MTPAILASTSSREQLLTNKLRKPMVEKIRRERINSSIERLKCLLAQEFLKQQPDSRQEKADILEMTLDFLRRSQSARGCSSATADGRSRCVQEAISFLSQCPVQTPSHRRLLEHFLHSQHPADHMIHAPNPQPNSKHQAPEIWRPW